MNVMDISRYQARAEVLKALAHPTRLLIVDQLKERDMSVQELRDLIGADMSTVSKHLSILKNVGIVKGDKQGAHVFYSLHLRCVINFFGCAEEVIQKVAEEKYGLIKKA